MIYRWYIGKSLPKAKTSHQVKEFTPSPLRGLFLEEEPRSGKTALVRTYFWLLSRGKAAIFYIQSEDGEIWHTSYVIPKCSKFPFMEKGSVQIGPCHTAEQARRRGLYFTTLNHIANDDRYKYSVLHMLVGETNTRSIGGIEKAGFTFCGYVKKTKLLKRYLAVREE